jgi:hypothetical protein
MASDGPPAALAWLATCGLLALPSIALAIGSALALSALRGLPQDSVRVLVTRGAVGLAAGLPPLVVFGALLKVTTHHRGLGGAAYGAGAVAALVFAAIVGVRVADGLVRWLGPRRAAFFAGALAASVLALGCAVLAKSGVGAMPARLEVGLVDAAVWAFALVVGAVVNAPARISRPLALVSTVAALALALAGILVPSRAPDVARAIDERAPVAAPFADALGLR